jgi:hypothetical protein
LRKKDELEKSRESVRGGGKETFRSIPSLIPIKIATDATYSENHFIFSEGSGFVSQNVLNLPKILTYCCAAT